jgi:hypothetical protein
MLFEWVSYLAFLVLHAIFGLADKGKPGETRGPVYAKCLSRLATPGPAKPPNESFAVETDAKPQT